MAKIGIKKSLVNFFAAFTAISMNTLLGVLAHIKIAPLGFCTCISLGSLFFSIGRIIH
jgi:hypothetical protein